MQEAKAEAPSNPSSPEYWARLNSELPPSVPLEFMRRTVGKDWADKKSLPRVECHR